MDGAKYKIGDLVVMTVYDAFSREKTAYGVVVAMVRDEGHWRYQVSHPQGYFLWRDESQLKKSKDVF
jgi:hypothetical protein